MDPRREVTVMSQIQWMDDALCQQIDGELFFPEPNRSAAEARKACALCPVQVPCLEYALTFDVDGIWAGTNRQQRAQLKKGAAYRNVAS
jgi:WhiB family redox-sensing transcriptional regulator